MKVYCVFEELSDDFGDFVLRLISIHKDEDSAYKKMSEIVKNAEKFVLTIKLEEWEIEE